MATKWTKVEAPLVDFNALRGWMDAQGLDGDEISRIRPIGGGTQNIMLQFSRGGRAYVLRRGPEHLRPQSNKVIRREMQLLAALAGTDVPHPRLICGCDDEAVLGAVFYLMDPVDGYNAAVDLSLAHASDPSVRFDMGMALVDALTTLGNVEYDNVGLADFGRPSGFLERQTPRWLSELESYAGTPGYPGPELAGVDRVAQWLDDNRPTDWTPGILHGDFHIANVMYSRTSPDVAAIVDWEMSTIGDPLLDLGLLLAIWPDADGAPDILESALVAAGGLPTRSELVRRYAERSQRDLRSVEWYTGLACFKLGIILEGTYARACAGNAPVEVGNRLHRYAMQLFDRAHTVLARV